MMKSKLLLTLLTLGLLGDSHDSQAGIGDFIWENRVLIASVVVVAVAIYAYRTPDDRVPDDRDQVGQLVSPSKFIGHKLSHSPRSASDSRPRHVLKRPRLVLELRKITENLNESASDND